jgi:hypothetical protein
MRAPTTSSRERTTRTGRAVAIRARSIDTQFLDTLQGEGLSGRVHSVFERVINIECNIESDIECDCGELFTLACRDLDDAPSTAILELTGFGATRIAVGDPVDGMGERLRVGDCLVVVPPTASRWDCMLPSYPKATATLRANLRVLQAHLERLGATGGMRAPRHPANEFEATVSELLEERAAQLQHSLARADFSSARHHAKGMLGLGPGLTPSGDDFLVGLFAVLNIPGSPCHGWLGGGADVLAAAARSTHAISLAALTQAARGRVRESIAALVEHLMVGAPERLVLPLRRVLAIGSTSGADIVAGIRCGFELNISHGGMPSCQSKW